MESQNTNLSSTPLPEGESTVSQVTSMQPSSNKTLQSIIVLLVCAVLAGGGYWYYTKNRLPAPASTPAVSVSTGALPSATSTDVSTKDCIKLMLSQPTKPACFGTLSPFDILIDYNYDKVHDDTSGITYYESEPSAEKGIMYFYAGNSSWYKIVESSETGSAAREATSNRIYKWGYGYMFVTDIDKNNIWYTSSSTPSGESKRIITPEDRQGQSPIIYSFDQWATSTPQITFYGMTPAGFAEKASFSLPTPLLGATVGVPCGGDPCNTQVPFKYTGTAVIGIYYYDQKGEQKTLPVNISI